MNNPNDYKHPDDILTSMLMWALQDAMKPANPQSKRDCVLDEIENGTSTE